MGRAYQGLNKDNKISFGMQSCSGKTHLRQKMFSFHF